MAHSTPENSDPGSGDLVVQLDRTEQRLEARRLSVAKKAKGLRQTALTRLSDTLHSPLVLGVAAASVGAGLGLWAYRNHKAKGMPKQETAPPTHNSGHTRQLLSTAFTLANTALTFMALRQQRKNSDDLGPRPR